ncbi:MAG: hypothetical protein R2706_02560 [Acidimicrobiales bacterium]
MSNVGVGLFEIGLLRRLAASDQIRFDPGVAVTNALRVEGAPGCSVSALLASAVLGYWRATS